MTDIEFEVKPFHYSVYTRKKIQAMRRQYKDIMSLEGYHKYRVIGIALEKEIKAGNAHSKNHMLKKLDESNKQALEYGSN